jgi:transposase
MFERKTYTEEFKREAVRLCDSRGNASAVARDLGISVNLLRKWKQRLAINPDRPFPGQGNPQDAELAQARREIARLRQDNEILKKAVGIFTNRPE